MVPFYGWGLTASRLEPLGGDSLPFTSKFPEIPDTHFIDLNIHFIVSFLMILLVVHFLDIFIYIKQPTSIAILTEK